MGRYEAMVMKQVWRRSKRNRNYSAPFACRSYLFNL